MFLDDFLPLLVGCLGILVIHADVVGAERAMIIGVGLGIWDRIEFPEDVSGTHEQSSQKQFVLHGIIIRRLGKRDAVRLNLGQAEAKIVRLHLPVPGTLLSGGWSLIRASKPLEGSPSTTNGSTLPSN